MALLLLAAFLGLTGAYALIDPAAAQMANDGDPFGAPPAWWVDAAWIAVAAAMAAAGARLLTGGGRAGARR